MAFYGWGEVIKDPEKLKKVIFVYNQQFISPYCLKRGMFLDKEGFYHFNCINDPCGTPCEFFDNRLQELMAKVGEYRKELDRKRRLYEIKNKKKGK